MSRRYGRQADGQRLAELRAGETAGRIRRKAQPAATAADAAPTSAPTRKAAMKASADPRAKTNPSSAVAISPAMRATALLNPDAVPTWPGSTEAITVVVKGATLTPIPI